MVYWGDCMERIIESIGYTSNAYESVLGALCAKYRFLKSFSFGSAVSGTRLRCVYIGTGRDRLLFTAAIHGNEYITATVLLKWIEQLCISVKLGLPFCGINFFEILKAKTLYFVPVCNPDGCDVVLGVNRHLLSPCFAETNFKKWKANLNGVDLNHNFDADWDKTKDAELAAGIINPRAAYFGGEYPESEPETVALCTLCNTLKFSAFYGLHTQGEVIYCGYGALSDIERKMASIFSVTSGYGVSVPNAISAAGGFKDWFSLKFKRPAFTFELGRGENPLPIIKSETIYRRICETLAIAAVM